LSFTRKRKGEIISNKKNLLLVYQKKRGKRKKRKRKRSLKFIFLSFTIKGKGKIVGLGVLVP
jgi:hypothetical protein